MRDEPRVYRVSCAGCGERLAVLTPERVGQWARMHRCWERRQEGEAA